MIAGRAGDFLEPERHVGLGSEIEFHVSMNREGVETLLTETSPVTIRPHKPLVDRKARLFADGAGDRIQASFDFLLGQCNHDG